MRFLIRLRELASGFTFTDIGSTSLKLVTVPRLRCFSRKGQLEAVDSVAPHCSKGTGTTRLSDGVADGSTSGVTVSTESATFTSSQLDELGELGELVDDDSSFRISSAGAGMPGAACDGVEANKRMVGDAMVESS